MHYTKWWFIAWIMRLLFLWCFFALARDMAKVTTTSNLSFYTKTIIASGILSFICWMQDSNIEYTSTTVDMVHNHQYHYSGISIFTFIVIPSLYGSFIGLKNKWKY